MMLHRYQYPTPDGYIYISQKVALHQARQLHVIYSQLSAFKMELTTTIALVHVWQDIQRHATGKQPEKLSSCTDVYLIINYYVVVV